MISGLVVIVNAICCVIVTWNGGAVIESVTWSVFGSWTCNKVKTKEFVGNEKGLLTCYQFTSKQSLRSNKGTVKIQQRTMKSEIIRPTRLSEVSVFI